MKKEFKPASGAEGWQISNYPVLSGAAQLAALEIFRKAGMKRLVKKSRLLSSYLYFLLKEIPSDRFVVITPEDPSQRGSQLSILMKSDGKKVFQSLAKAGVIADWREPDVIRIAPVPLYNTFEEVYRFAGIFNEILAR
jgi:kynureninase